MPGRLLWWAGKPRVVNLPSSGIAASMYMDVWTVQSYMGGGGGECTCPRNSPSAEQAEVPYTSKEAIQVSMPAVPFCSHKAWLLGNPRAVFPCHQGSFYNLACGKWVAGEQNLSAS